ncbi:Gfo/Idh/MocA family oxidoreductase [Fervidobacterium riparium]|nr:hypothetical protein IB67_05265 [Fervidobacterium riparium]
MKKLRIGVIGAGKISEVLHVPNTVSSKYAQLVGIADSNEQRLSLFKSLLKDERVHFYTEYHELLERDDVDAVIVALPNYLHARVTIEALEKGKNVLVEKPMATSFKEAMEMLRTAKEVKRVLMPNHSQRFFPHHLKAKEIIQSGLLGNIRLVKTMFSHSGPENWSPNANWFFQKNSAMFGALGDLGIHKIDLIRYLTGLEVTECIGITTTLEKRGTVEDIGSAILKLSNGAIATLDANWITKGLEENYFVIYGENGTLKIGQTDPSKIDVYLARPVEMHGETSVRPLFTNQDPFWKMPIIDHFSKVCLGLEEPIVRAEDGVIGIKIIEKIFESSNKDFR